LTHDILPFWLCRIKRLNGHPPVRRERAPGSTDVLLDPEGFAMLPRALTCHPTIKVTGADETGARSTQSLLLRANEVIQ